MTTYNTQYVTDQGLAIPSVADILTALTTDQRNLVPTLNTSADSPIGQLNGVFATHLREAYEVAQIAFSANDPNQAEGALLDWVSALTGTSRAPATYSSFQGVRALDATINAMLTIPAGTAFSSQDGSATFTTTSDIVLSAASYPATLSAAIACTCTVAGPVQCNAGQCTVFAPITGLASVVNQQDAYAGTAADNDAALRLRRGNELGQHGSGTVTALRANLYAIELADGTKPILSVVILENTSDQTDARGLAPHSLECVVNDGILAACPNNVIAQAIWDVRPGGIAILGTTSATAVDADGNNQTVKFTRPTQDAVYFQVTLWLADVNQHVAQFSPQVIAAIQSVATSYLQAANSGIKVYPRRYESAILQIPGVTDCAVQLSSSSESGGAWQPVDVPLQLDVRSIGYTESGFVYVVQGT